MKKQKNKSRKTSRESSKESDKSKKLKILMLNYEFPPLGGGAGNATYYLLKEFAKYPNIEIDLITSSIDKERVKKFSKNITIYFLYINKKGNLHYQSQKDLLKYSWKAYKLAKKLKKTKNYNLCHAFFGIPCGYIAMKLKIPYIVSLRGSDVPFYNNRFYWFDKFIFKRISKKVWKNSKATITNSKGLKELALNSSPNQKIEVIYNGVNTEEFKPLKNKKHNKKIVIISTGRLIERKGYEYLLEALKENKNFELWLVGDGNLKGRLKDISNKNKVNVKFLGKIDHSKINNLLQKADIFCLPSLNEGMSNSILEAMACGLPIITTNVGGSQELINGNGFVLNKESSEELKEAIEKYLKNPKLLKIHGNKSRLLAERMSWENVAGEYLKEYKI